MGYDGSDKGKIDQGGNEAGEAADDAAIRMDLDVAAIVSIFG